MQPFVLVALATLGLASGAVLPLTAGVASQYHAQDELGQYTYGYAGGPSAKHETKTADGITRGGYSYIDANGFVQSAAYVADPVNGFRVAATNLPAGPAPVPVAAPIAVAAPVPVALPTPVLSLPAAPLPEPVAVGPAVVPAAPVAVGPAVVPSAPVAIEAAPAPAPASDMMPIDSSDTVEIKSAQAAPAPAPVMPSELPKPVMDTPEVAQAKAMHMAAVAETKARDEAMAAMQPMITTYVAAAPAPVVAAPIAPVVAAAPVSHAVVAAPVIAPHVASQYHAQDELGQYTYGYAGGPSAKHETKTFDGVTRGGYSYVDAHGLVQSAAYVSDPMNGFRVAATNLPVQPAPTYLADTPEVAAAKAKLFQAQAEHIAKL